jgi:WD repeat-containing protein 35
LAQNFELTDDHLKLLYLISKYTRTAKRSFEKDKWIKEFTLRALIYEGIVNNVFNYDYSPMSIEMIGGRRILNISQDAEDDIADLREMKMLDCLRLSSTNYRLTNLYKISQEGMKVEIPTQFKEQIDSLCKCRKCGSLLELE